MRVTAGSDECSLVLIKLKDVKPLDQGSPSSVLGGRCPAEFSFNPNQTHLKQLMKVFLGILDTRQVCGRKLELNSAGHRPSRTELGDALD